MVAPYLKPEQIPGAVANKASELQVATAQKTQEMQAPLIPGVEVDPPVGSPEYQRGQEAIQLAQQDLANSQTQPMSAADIAANQRAIEATKPFYRKMIPSQIGPEFGGTGPNTGNFFENEPVRQPALPQQTGRTVSLPEGQRPPMSQQDQYLADLRDMPIAALRQKYGNGALRDKMTLNVADATTERYDGAERDLGTVATDALNSAQVWLGQTARTGVGIFNQASRNVQDLLAEATGQDVGQSTLIDNLGADKPLQEFVDEQRSQYSPEVRYQQSVVEAQKEAYKDAGPAREAADVAKGDNPLVAGAKEQLRQFVNTAQTYGDAPGALTTLIAESAPDLLSGGLIGKLASRGAFKELAKEYGDDFATKLAGTKFGREKLQGAAESAFIAYTGVMEGGSNMVQALDQVDQMKNEDLEKNSPMYRDLIKEGATPEEARNVIKQQVGNVSGLVAGTLGMAAGRLAAPFESRLFSPTLLEGTGVRAAAGRVLGNVLREGAEETSQGASGQFASNLGVRSAADETQNLSEDVGSSAAESGLAGIGMGAVGSVVSETPRAVVGVGNTASDAVNTVREKRAETKAQDFRNTVNTANETVAATTPTPDADTTPSETVRAQDAVTTPEAKQVFKAIPEEQISSPDSILRIARAVRNQQLDEASRRDLATVGNNVISAYEEAIPQITADMNAAPEDQKAQYQTALDNINAVLAHPDVQAVKATAEGFKLTPDEIASVFDSLPSEITPEIYKSPEVKDSVQKVLSQVNLDSSSITPEVAQKLANAGETIGLTPNQVNQLNVIANTNKDIAGVGNDVRQGSDGFIGIQQYQQGIFRAQNIGDTKRAKGLLDHLDRFANHMETKAQAFQNVADTFTGSQPVEVINPTTGQPYMSLDGTPMTYHPVRSKNLINEIQRDAAAVRNAHTITSTLVDGGTVPAPAPVEATAESAQTEEPAPVTTSPVTQTQTKKAPTWDTMRSGQSITLYRGENGTNEEGGQWWTTDEAKAKRYGEVQSVTLPSEVIANNAARGHNGADEFVFPNKRPTDLVDSQSTTERIEPIQGEFDLGDLPTREVSQEAPVETDTLETNPDQEKLPLNEGTNHDLIAGLMGTTQRSDAKTMSDADKNYQETNQVKKWFKPTGRRSAFLRTSNFSTRVAQAFQTGNPITQLQNLFKGFVEPEQVTETEASVMRQYAALVPAVEQALIQAWGKLTPEGQRIFWEKAPVEYFDEVRNINGENVYFLPQTVIEAMTAGMMQWFVRGAPETVFNDARAVMDILGLDNKTKPTVEQNELLGEVGTDRQNVIQELSQEIFGILGIQADPNTPVSTRDAIAKSVAAEVLNVMINAGLVQESVITNRELASVGSAKVNDSNIKNTRIFVRVNPESEAASQMMDLMGKSNDLLGQLTNPRREKAGAYFDTPPKNQSTKVKNGGGQDIPEKMVSARNKASAQPHYVNMGLHDLLLNKLGTPWIERMLGLQSEETANGAHLQSIQGSNRTIQRDVQTLIKGLTRISEAGKDLASTEIYFPYNVISNFRMMLNSGDLNPQAAKLHRELITVAPSTIQLNNPQHGAFLDYAIAQGLDISVDKLSSETARTRLNKVIDTGLFRDAIEILKGVENSDEVSDADAEVLLNAVNAGKEKTKTLHALYAQAQYELAVQNGQDSFQTHVMLELDGVTNGPFNSIVQLGLTSVNQDLLNKLEKGGLFYGQSDMLYNERAETPGFLDLYKTAASGTQTYINNMMDAFRQIPSRLEKTKRMSSKAKADEIRSIEKLRTQMRVTLAASKLIGDVNIVEGEDVEHPIQIGRGLLKNPVTVTVYSGGATAINRKMAVGIANGYYEAITDALRTLESATTQEERDTAIAHMQDLTTTTNELTTAIVYRNGSFVKIGAPIDLGDDVTKFEFSGEQIEAITHNIRIGLGSAVNQSIADEFGTVIQRGQMMVFAAGLMHELFMARWNKAVTAREAELREAGELSKYESLSQAQYAEIKQQLITQMPVFNSWFTAGNTEPSQMNTGILLSEEGSVPSDNLKLESRGRREVNGKMSKSSFVPDVPTYTEPGTRVMPLLVQSVEAAMQAIARDINPNNALNVFDGYINAVEHLESGSQAINQGVLQSWNEFDLLQDFTNRFEQAMSNADLMNELSSDADERLQQSYRSIAGLIDADAIASPRSQDVIDAFTILLKKEAATQTAIKQGLFSGDAVTSINQMTGANVTFNIQNGKQVPIEATTEQTPLEQLVNNTELPTLDTVPLPTGRASIPASPRLEQAFKDNGVSMSSYEGVTVMTKSQVLAAIREAAKALPSRQNKITAFILNKIEGSIPDDVMVYAGNPEQLSAIDRALNPDTETQFSKEMLGMTDGKFVFIGSASIETVLHELIHTATAQTVMDYYSNPENLSSNQRLEVASIEALMNRFLNEYQAEQSQYDADTNNVIQVIAGHAEAGNTAEAVAEFISWGLTNPRMIDALTAKTTGNTVTRVLKELADTIKKLFAIGSNPEITSYWTRLLGHTVALAQSTEAVKNGREYTLSQQNANNINDLDAETLFNQLNSGNASTEHVNHLTDTLDYLQSNIVRLIKQTGQDISGLTHFQDKLMLNSIDPEIDQSPDALIAHGFNMSEKEALVFKMMQVSLKYGLENFGPSVLAARSLYAQARAALKPFDFLTDPTNTSPTEMALAQQRYDAVFGNTAITQDATGRTNRLANFMALAETNESLRNKLKSVAFQSKSKEAPTSLLDKIGQWIMQVLTWLSGLATKSLGKPDIASRLTQVAKNLSKVDADARNTLLGRIENGSEAITQATQDKLNKFGHQIRNQLLKIEAKAPASVAFGMKVGSTLFNDNDAQDVRTALMTMVMTMQQGKKFSGLAELFSEFVGTNETNQSIHTLLVQKNMAADKARQLVRDLVPGIIEKAFVSLNETEKYAVQRAVAKTDMAYLYQNGYALDSLRNLLTDPSALQKEVSRVESELMAKGGVNGAFYTKSAHGLALQMTSGVSPLAHQLSNAQAIAQLIGTGRAKPSKQFIADVAPLIDTLASLRALQEVSAADKASVANLINREMTKGDPLNNGMTFTLNYYTSLQGAELAKAGVNNSLSAIKGYTPAITDPNKKVLIASTDDHADLMRRGYTQGARVNRDGTDVNQSNLYYYHSNNGGEPRWVAGVMSTLQTTVGGVNPLTGRTVNGTMTPGIWNYTDRNQVGSKKEAAIDDLFDANIPMPTSGNHLQPVLNRAGTVIGYSYQMPTANRDAHLDTDYDFAKTIGAWEGRIIEEVQAQKYNEMLLEKLHEQFRKDVRMGNGYQYLTIDGKSTDPQLREIWELMPIEMKEAAKRIFANGEIKVRKDLLNNALGFREPSVLNMWTGKSGLPQPVQVVFTGLFDTFLGKDAARYLRLGERGMMELVKEMKDWIVVRSVVVSAANLVSNAVHLLSLGIGPSRIIKDTSTAVLAAEEYRKNEKLINEYSRYLALNHNPAMKSEYERTISELRDSQARNPVAELIKAGLLPTITEDLGQQDEYSLKDKLLNKLKPITNKIPDSVSNVAKELIVARDSHVYFALNRSIQYGDFVAKYSLYKELTERKVNPLDKETALARVMDEFVNYDILPGQTRYYLDAIGATWFLNYKIRIQKIILRTFRDNPLRALFTILNGHAGIPNIADANLLTGSLSYNLGWGTLDNGLTAHPLYNGMK